MKKIFQFFILISVGLIVNACYYEAYPIYDPDPEDPGEETVSYKNDVIPLWSQCVGCHKGSTPPDLRDDDTHSSYDSLLNGYVVPGNSDASVLYQSLINSNNVSLMPPGTPWPQTKINTVKAWIDQGAENN